MSNPSNSLANNTPQGLRARNSFRLRSRNCMLAIPPTPAPPTMAALRWDRWNQRFDGTHFWGGIWRGLRADELSTALLEAGQACLVRIGSRDLCAHRFVHSKAFSSKD